MIYYLSLQEVLQLHSKTVEISGGGSSSILNLGQIESILEHIKNDDYYPTIVDKLTHLFFGFPVTYTLWLALAAAAADEEAEEDALLLLLLLIITFF